MSKPKRVVWFSARHEPAPAQMAELQRLWPGCEVVTVANTWSDIDGIIAKFHDLGGDEMAAVLPLSIVRLLTDKGHTILWSVMEQVREPGAPYDIEDRYKNRVKRFKFHGFKRLKRVKMILEDIKPEPKPASAS